MSGSAKRSDTVLILTDDPATRALSARRAAEHLDGEGLGIDPPRGPAAYAGERGPCELERAPGGPRDVAEDPEHVETRSRPEAELRRARTAVGAHPRLDRDTVP